MRAPKPPLFLARQSYRRRRLGDAARLLPAVGAVLFLLPLLGPGGGAGRATSAAGLFLFGAWAVLIVAAALLGRGLRDHAGSAGKDAD